VAGWKRDGSANKENGLPHAVFVRREHQAVPFRGYRHLVFVTELYLPGTSAIGHTKDLTSKISLDIKHQMKQINKALKKIQK
jgi:hypothetical protein